MSPMQNFLGLDSVHMVFKVQPISNLNLLQKFLTAQSGYSPSLPRQDNLNFLYLRYP